METQWPQLSYENGKETYNTLHMWTQIIGKIKLATLPWVNHSWHVALYISMRGLTTSVVPYKNQNFQIDFDFIDHTLKIITSRHEVRQFNLGGISVAEFYRKVFTILSELEIDVMIKPVPVEIVNPIPFLEDNVHATYRPEDASAFHKVLLNIQDVMVNFRSKFIGKCSPIHFFWGSFDLAFSRFSGRRAPKHPGGVPNLPDWVAEEAYSHEVSSCGFWTGNDTFPYPAFYAYIYPEPAGYKEAVVLPEEAFYHKDLGEFVLPYNVVQQAEDPAKVLLNFLTSTYKTSSHLANWDKDFLEK